MYKIVALSLAVAVAVTPSPSFASQDENGGSATNLDRVICKRENAIGSRVQKRRICKTSRDWANSQDRTRDSAGEMIGKSTQGAPPQ